MQARSDAGPLTDSARAASEGDESYHGPSKTGVPPAYVRGRARLARYLDISPRSVSRLISEGRIPFARLGHRLVIFRIADVDRALARLQSDGEQGGAR
jgi:excisionase family DNA binding protein